MTKRLFLALNIPDEIKDIIIKEANKTAGKGARFNWEKREKLHLTVKFLGDTDSNLIDEIINNLLFIEDIEEFEGMLQGFGFFYRHKKPAILYVDLKFPPVLLKIVDKLNENLFKLGIQKEDREFKEHITILRIRDKFPPKLIDRFKEDKIQDITFKINDFSLIESKLLPTGSVYNEIKKFHLKT